MTRIVLLFLLLTSLAQAESAKLLNIVSENILKVEHDGVVKNIHLAGIALFATANNKVNAFDNIAHDKRDELKAEALSYIESKLTIDSTIKYHPFYDPSGNITTVWIDDEELNYRMIRDGYALLDINDAILPTVFQNRMSIAMKYAKDKKLGLWSEESASMLALVDMSQHMCGWKETPLYKGIDRMAILKHHQESLPKVVRTQPQMKVALQSH